MNIHWISSISDAHINEAMKLEVMIPKAAAMIPSGEHEVKIEDDDFIGFIDLLAPAKTEQKLGGEYQVIPNVYDLYDFKYSNNVSRYKDSPQLHLYKYFLKEQSRKNHQKTLFSVCAKGDIKAIKERRPVPVQAKIAGRTDKKNHNCSLEYDLKGHQLLLSTKGMWKQGFPKKHKLVMQLL